MAIKYVLISCWEEHGGKPGLGLLCFDEDSGFTRLVNKQYENISFNNAYYNKENKVVYICNEVHNNPDYPKGGGGLIYAFKFDKEKELLNQISRVESLCPCPSYVCLDKSKKYLVNANHSSFNAVTIATKSDDGYWGLKVIYDDAIVSLRRVDIDGSLQEVVDVKKHDKYKVIGRGLHAHPHSCNLTPDGKFFVCCDKGDSHIYLYSLDYEYEKLILISEPYLDAEGAAPRYVVFHPFKNWMFVNHEKDLHLSSFSYSSKGKLEHLDSCEVLNNNGLKETNAIREVLHHESVDEPKDHIWPVEQQGLAISSDGKYLYDAINGADAVSVLEIDQNNGHLKLVQVMPINGRWVRGVNISPDNRFLFVSCLQEGGVYVYKLNTDGTLGDVISHVDIDGGSTITFLD